MIGLGTIVNTAAVVAGGLLGLLLKNGIAKRFEKILMQTLGLATIFIGAGGVLQYMLVVKDGVLSTQGTMLLIFSLVIGCVIGQLLDIEDKMEKLGTKLKAAVGRKNRRLILLPVSRWWIPRPASPCMTKPPERSEPPRRCGLPRGKWSARMSTTLSTISRDKFSRPNFQGVGRKNFASSSPFNSQERNIS